MITCRKQESLEKTTSSSTPTITQQKKKKEDRLRKIKKNMD
jgi:hypothetical protein